LLRISHGASETSGPAFSISPPGIFEAMRAGRIGLAAKIHHSA
jgi:hypothetical protein